MKTAAFPIVLVLILLALVVEPLGRQSDQAHEDSMNMARASVDNFVETVTSKGYVDNRDYTVFRQELDSTGYVFEVSLEYLKKKYQPLYDDPNNFYTFKENFEVMYDGYYTKDILTKLFPNNGTAENDPSRRYNLRPGDLFVVRINSLSETPGAELSSLILDKADPGKSYSGSGRVRNEAP